MSSFRQPFSRGAMSSGGAKKGSKVKIRHPPELDRRVVMRGVKVDVIKPWIAQRVTELLGVEDDVLISMIYNFLEMDAVHESGADIYVQLLTFLEKNTALFMKELWDLLVSASENPSGIPQQFIDQKEADLKRQREIAEELKRRQSGGGGGGGAGGGRGAIQGASGAGVQRTSRWDRDRDNKDHHVKVEAAGAGRGHDRGRDGERDHHRDGRREPDRGDRGDRGGGGGGGGRQSSRSRSRSRSPRRRSRSRSRSRSRDREERGRYDRYRR